MAVTFKKQKNVIQADCITTAYQLSRVSGASAAPIHHGLKEIRQDFPT